MRRHRKIRILFVPGLLAFLVIGSTFAYFGELNPIANNFYTTEPEVYLEEKFNPYDQWVPGEKKQKEVRFGNEGQMAAVLRVKFIPYLERGENKVTLSNQEITLNFDDSMQTEWVRHGDWYYYCKVLEPKERTGITLNAVTISAALGNDEHGIQTDYSGAVFDVEIIGELLQASLAEEIAGSQGWAIPSITNSQVSWQYQQGN